MEASLQPFAASMARPKPAINFRLVGLIALAAVPFLWVIKVIVIQSVTGGRIDHGSYVEVDLKSLGRFEFDPDRGSIKDVPARWRELEGRRVMLVGVMYAPTQAAAINQFELVYNVAMCCINGPPRVQERVFMTMPKGKSATYHDGNVRVVGTLHVKDRKDAGRTVSIFTMVPESIDPA